MLRICAILFYFVVVVAVAMLDIAYITYNIDEQQRPVIRNNFAFFHINKLN